MSATEQQQERRVYAKPNGVGGVEVSMRDPRFAALPTAQVQLNGQQAFEFADEILTALDAGGQAHELIISLGDCSFSARCKCGAIIGQMIRPDQSFDLYVAPWERHVMATERGEYQVVR